MNKFIGDPVPGKSPERSIPSDIFDASVRSQRGEMVNITSLIPAKRAEGKFSFQLDVQRAFDRVAQVLNSDEYSQFLQEIESNLSEVTGQNFIFDIEGTFMNDRQNLNDLSERVYFVNPWMRSVILTLLKNGNGVGFWTSANNQSLEKMRKAMSPEMATLPAIGREQWEEIVELYHSRVLNQLADKQILEKMQAIYPTTTADTFQTGLGIFNDKFFEYYDPKYFARGNKYPQLFLSTSNGFFIDDNSTFLESATIRGWPEERAIKCSYDPEKENVIEVTKAIQAVVAKHKKS